MIFVKMRSAVLLFSLVLTVSAWDDGDFEVFDAVEEVNQNFYELLGVKQEASPAEIKSAFKKLTLKLHPDKNDAPDADVQFRNLVSVHNVLKDPGKREKYNEVLMNGLPNWRSALYYYRHVRKMGLAEGAIIIFIITTLGQYAVSWAAYVEKRFTAESILNSRGKKHSKKSGFDAGLAEILEQLPKPSVRDTLPFQIPRAAWWLVTALPRAVDEYKRVRREREEEARRQVKREEEERKREIREAAAAEAAKEKGARRRRAFLPPAREPAACLLDPAAEPDSPPDQKLPPVVVGGLWTDDDLAELVRLVKKFPGGAADRWETIAGLMRRPVQEVTHMAAKMKENCYKMPAPEPEPAPTELNKKVKTRKTEEVSGGIWSQTQQKALETALAKFPKGGAGDRWQKIAGSVPGKTKEECMQRCKYLSDLVRKQKQKEEEEKEKEQVVEEEPQVEETQSEQEVEVVRTKKGKKKKRRQRHESEDEELSDTESLTYDQEYA